MGRMVIFRSGGGGRARSVVGERRPAERRTREPTFPGFGRLTRRVPDTRLWSGAEAAVTSVSRHHATGEVGGTRAHPSWVDRVAGATDFLSGLRRSRTGGARDIMGANDT